MQPWTWTHVTMLGSLSVEETDEYEIPDFEGFDMHELEAAFGPEADARDGDPR